jgi:hypothetical protein
VKAPPASESSKSGAAQAMAPVSQPASPSKAAAPESNADKLGAPIVSAKTVPLSEIASHPAQYAKGGVVKTEGQVTAVCQAMGCWMEITDKTADAHIRMSGHSFFVPKSAAGRHAVVEGTVLARPDQGECEEEAKQATGKVVKVELDATGVELL